MSERALKIAEWSALAAVGATGFYNGFTPSLSDVKRDYCQGAPDEIRTRLADLRESYAKATFLAGILGVAASIAVQSPIPLLATGAAAGVMVASYEHAVSPEYRLLSGRAALPDPNIIEGTWRVVS